MSKKKKLARITKNSFKSNGERPEHCYKKTAALSNDFNLNDIYIGGFGENFALWLGLISTPFVYSPSTVWIAETVHFNDSGSLSPPTETP